MIKMKKILIIILLTIYNTSIQATNQEIIEWSSQQARGLLEFSYQNNPNDYWQPYKLSFTKNGWADFQKNLQKSDTIKIIKEFKLSSHISFSNKSTISAIKKDAWQLNLPATIIYAGKKVATSYNIMINMTIKIANHKQLIENMKTTVIGLTNQKSIYPRGCHLRQYS